jgi:hypothetical protein
MDAEKTIGKKPTSLHEKSNEETRNRRSYLNIMKVMYDTLLANIILNGEKLKTFLLKSGMRQVCPLSPLLFSIVFEFLAREIRQEKEMEWVHTGKKN